MITMQDLYDTGLDPDEIGELINRHDDDCDCERCLQLISENMSRVGGDI